MKEKGSISLRQRIKFKYISTRAHITEKIRNIQGVPQNLIEERRINICCGIRWYDFKIIITKLTQSPSPGLSKMSPSPGMSNMCSVFFVF